MNTNVETSDVEDDQVNTNVVEDDQVKKWLDRFFSPLAEAYIEICNTQKRQFYGLRDFYRYAVFHTHLISPLQLHLILLL